MNEASIFCSEQYGEARSRLILYVSKRLELPAEAFLNVPSTIFNDANLDSISLIEFLMEAEDLLPPH